MEVIPPFRDTTTCLNNDRTISHVGQAGFGVSGSFLGRFSAPETQISPNVHTQPSMMRKLMIFICERGKTTCPISMASHSAHELPKEQASKSRSER